MMTDKEIMIDGVNVAGCEYFGGYGQECSSEDAGMRSCDEHPDCYYKQLQRKTQECEELAAEVKTIGHAFLEKGDLLNKALEKIKELVTITSQMEHSCATETIFEIINEVLNDN